MKHTTPLVVAADRRNPHVPVRRNRRILAFFVAKVRVRYQTVNPTFTIYRDGTSRVSTRVPANNPIGYIETDVQRFPAGSKETANVAKVIRTAYRGDLRRLKTLN